MILGPACRAIPISRKGCNDENDDGEKCDECLVRILYILTVEYINEYIVLRICVQCQKDKPLSQFCRRSKFSRYN